jgi:hypothetical protein
MTRFCFGIFVIIWAVNADIYLHFPPGSNNRVNENTANRQNPQNAFDSQNNNKGGYNVPDATNKAYDTDASLQYYLVSLKQYPEFELFHSDQNTTFEDSH